MGRRQLRRRLEVGAGQSGARSRGPASGRIAGQITQVITDSELEPQVFPISSTYLHDY